MVRQISPKTQLGVIKSNDDHLRLVGLTHNVYLSVDSILTSIWIKNY